MNISKITAISGLALLTILTCTCAHANGYKTLGIKSAKANAMGEAFTVQADDPSAVAFNPAGLAGLRGNQVALHITACNPLSEHTSPTGAKTDAAENWEFIPAFFFSSDMGFDDVGAGVGISFPNGISREWREDSFARYVATFSRLVVADVDLAMGCRVNDRLAVGGGLNFYYSTVTLERMVDAGLAAGAPGAADVRSKISGDGTALGFNVGATYRIADAHRVGIVYRHPYTIDYKGDIAVAGTSSDAGASIDYPAVVVLGYAFEPVPELTIEVDLDWTGWGDVDDVVLSSLDGSFDDQVRTQDLDSTVAIKVGAEYRMSEELALRCGYIRNQNATSESTWRPSLPDADSHFLTAGVGYSCGGVTIDGAVQFILVDSRRIDNNVDGNETVSSSSIDGLYEGWGPCLSLACTYEF